MLVFFSSFILPFVCLRLFALFFKPRVGPSPCVSREFYVTRGSLVGQPVQVNQASVPPRVVASDDANGRVLALY